MLKKLIICVLLLSPTFLYTVAPNTVVGTINVGVTPAGLAVTPDNRFALVANNNNYAIAGADSVSVIDLNTNLLIKTITDASFNQPYTITINPAGTKAYVTNSVTTTITIIDIETMSVIGTIGGLNGPSDMAITADGTLGYVSNYGVMSGTATTVNIVDLNTNMVIGSALNVGLAPNALTITPDGKYVYVILYQSGATGSGTITTIRTSDNFVTQNVVTGLSGPFAIAITPDGKYAYVTNFGSNNFEPYGTTVSVIDLSNNSIIATITLGIQPAGLAITPDGRFAYASNYNALYADNMPYLTNLTPGQGTVNIIDIATNTVLPLTIPVDQAPSAIAISPDGEFAYVSNFISNTVNVIALQSFLITAQGCKACNRYLTQTDFISKLTWTVSGSSLPVSYSIYRDAALTDLAGTVTGIPQSTTQHYIFLDHNRNPNVTYTYYIVGTNQVGTTSEPIVVTATESC